MKKLKNWKINNYLTIIHHKGDKFMKRILLITCLLANISVFSQKLVTDYLSVNTGNTTKIDAIKSETSKYQIYWDDPDFRYDWLEYYEIPYVIIDNQEDYEYIRYDNAVFIDFNKYVLFACLIRRESEDNNVNYGNGRPALDVYENRLKDVIYLRCPDTGGGIPLAGRNYIFIQISFMIPRKYYEKTQTIYLNEPIRPKPALRPAQRR